MSRDNSEDKPSATTELEIPPYAPGISKPDEKELESATQKLDSLSIPEPLRRPFAETSQETDLSSDMLQAPSLDQPRESLGSKSNASSVLSWGLLAAGVASIGTVVALGPELQFPAMHDVKAAVQKITQEKKPYTSVIKQTAEAEKTDQEVQDVQLILSNLGDAYSDNLLQHLTSFSEEINPVAPQELPVTETDQNATVQAKNEVTLEPKQSNTSTQSASVLTATKPIPVATIVASAEANLANPSPTPVQVAQANTTEFPQSLVSDGEISFGQEDALNLDGPVPEELPLQELAAPTPALAPAPVEIVEPEPIQTEPATVEEPVVEQVAEPEPVQTPEPVVEPVAEPVVTPEPAVVAVPAPVTIPDSEEESVATSEVSPQPETQEEVAAIATTPVEEQASDAVAEEAQEAVAVSEPASEPEPAVAPAPVETNPVVASLENFTFDMNWSTKKAEIPNLIDNCINITENIEGCRLKLDSWAPYTRYVVGLFDRANDSQLMAIQIDSLAFNDSSLAQTGFEQISDVIRNKLPANFEVSKEVSVENNKEIFQTLSNDKTARHFKHWSLAELAIPAYINLSVKEINSESGYIRAIIVANN